MPKVELDFIRDSIPTDEQLCLQLVYGLCGQLKNPKEEHIECFVTAVGIPNPFIRRLAKLLVEKLRLPVPLERVDEWVEWQRTNHCWIVDDRMSQEASRLLKLEDQ